MNSASPAARHLPSSCDQNGQHVSLRRLLAGHLAPYRRLFAGAVAFQAMQAFATLTLPSLNASIIDNGVLVGDNGHVVSIGAIMLAFTLAQVVFGACAVWFGARVAMGFGRDVRGDLFHRVTDFSAREVGHFGSSSLITRVTNDVQQVQMFVATATAIMISAPLTLSIGVLMAIREDVGLSVVLAVALPVSVVVLGLVIARMIPAFQQMQVRVDRVNRVLREQIAGMRVTRAFVREPEQTVRFGEANSDLTAIALRAGRLNAISVPAIQLIVGLSTIGVLWVGADRVGTGQLQIGSLIAYVSYLALILISLALLSRTVSLIPRASVAAERIMEVLETESSVTAPTEPMTSLVEHATVEFRGVGFAYAGADQPVLSDISFRVAAGETTAIIGSTGSGKTTLVNLVPRLFDATEGVVLVDGTDVRDLDASVLASKIGFVHQKPYLFSGTVASNVRFGRPEATDDQIWEVLDLAQAGDFVRAMPDGINSEVAQGGTNLSGGQRQRLSIARALVVRPEIYVFDDSFSALDLATDARLRAALAPHTVDAAVLVVAQRVSTIVGASQILVLEAGSIVGRGTYDELVVTCPTFAEIVASQLGEESAV